MPDQSHHPQLDNARELPAPVVTREHREAVDSCFDESQMVTDWRQWFDSKVGPVKQKLYRLLASRDAAAEARGRRLERDRFVAYLRAEAAHYKHNRNIGPYAAELTDLFESGAPLVPKEPWDV